MKHLNQMKMATLMSLTPMLFTIGCGLSHPEIATDSMTASQKKMVMTSQQAEARKQPTLTKLQGPKGKVNPAQALPTIQAPSLQPTAPVLVKHVKEECGVLMPVDAKREADENFNDLTPQELQDKFQLEWDVMTNRPGMPIYIYVNMFNEQVKWMEGKHKDLDGVDTLRKGQLKLQFRGHHEPGNYKKTLFFEYKRAIYKLPLCYNVN